MVRSEFYNRALNEICSWVNFLSLYWLEALDFCSVLRTDSFNYGWISIDALLHSLLFMRWLIDLTYWNSISLIFFFFLSLTLLSTSFSYVLFHNLESDFFSFVYAKHISVATMIWPIYHILTGFLDPDTAKWWVGY